MKKHILSLLMALTLCLGLAAPALAAPPADQAMKNVEWKSSLLVDNHLAEQDFFVPGEIRLDSVFDDDSDVLDGYIASSTKDVHTVKHTGVNDKDSYIMVSGYVYEKGAAGTYSAEGVGISGELYLVKNRGLILWEEGIEEEDIVKLHAGESASFTLPTKSPSFDVSSDAIFQIRVTLVYPDDSGHYLQSFLKLDEAAVSKVLATPPAVGARFTDVAANSPFRAAIDWAVDKGIAKGKTETTFAPNDYCTIRHILTFLWRANGQPGDSSNERAAVMAWAETKGITPMDFDARCTRATAMTYLWKAAGSPAPKAAAAFQDVSASAEYAKAVSWAVEQGITSGTTATTFSPDNFCTRGQIVTFLYRAA